MYKQSFLVCYRGYGLIFTRLSLYRISLPLLLADAKYDSPNILKFSENCEPYL